MKGLPTDIAKVLEKYGYTAEGRSGVFRSFISEDKRAEDKRAEDKRAEDELADLLEARAFQENPLEFLQKKIPLQYPLVVKCDPTTFFAASVNKNHKDHQQKIDYILELAVSLGDKGIEWINRKQSTISGIPFENTLLHSLISNTEFYEVEYILRHKLSIGLFDLSITDKQGKTILMLAIMMDSPQSIIKTIIEYMAPAQFDQELRGGDAKAPRTAIEFAAMMGRIDVIHLFPREYLRSILSDSKTMARLLAFSSKLDKKPIRTELRRPYDRMFDIRYAERMFDSSFNDCNRDAKALANGLGALNMLVYANEGLGKVLLYSTKTAEEHFVELGVTTLAPKTSPFLDHMERRGWRPVLATQENATILLSLSQRALESTRSKDDEKLLINFKGYFSQRLQELSGKSWLSQLQDRRSLFLGQLLNLALELKGLRTVPEGKGGEGDKVEASGLTLEPQQQPASESPTTSEGKEGEGEKIDLLQESLGLAEFSGEWKIHPSDNKVNYLTIKNKGDAERLGDLLRLAFRCDNIVKITPTQKGKFSIVIYWGNLQQQPALASTTSPEGKEGEGDKIDLLQQSFTP